VISIGGSYILEASRDQVWPRIFDPRSLVGLIPGYQRLEPEGPGEYRGQIALGLLAVMRSLVNRGDRRRPKSCAPGRSVTGPCDGSRTLGERKP